MSEEFHTPSEIVDNVRLKELIEASAAIKEVAETEKSLKILKRCSRPKKLRTQKKREDLEVIAESNPATALADSNTVVEDQVVKKTKRQTLTRPKNWLEIAEFYDQKGKNLTIKTYPDEFSDRSDRSADQALRQWRSDLKCKIAIKSYDEAPAFGIKDLEVVAEISPATPTRDDIYLDIVVEDQVVEKKKRQALTRPKNWLEIAEFYDQKGKNLTIKTYPDEFSDRSDRSADQALRQWRSDLKSKIQFNLIKNGRAPAYGNDVDLLLKKQVNSRTIDGLSTSNIVLRLLLVELLQEKGQSDLLCENGGIYSFGHGWASRFWKRHEVLITNDIL